MRRRPVAAAPSQPLVTSAYAPFTGPGARSAPPRVDIGLPVQTAQNSQVAQSVDGPVGGNPFGAGSSPVPTIDEPAPPSGTAVSTPTPGLSTDTITAQIDLGIQQVQADIAPRIEGSLSIRGRTGTPGFERLIELAAPIEASYSPNGYGRLRVVVTPTYLYSGQSTDSYDVQRYGHQRIGQPGPFRVRRAA